MKEMAFGKIKGISVGNAQDPEAMTGVSVLLFDQGYHNTVGVSVTGGGPASRETALLSPYTNDHMIHAIMLAGGSAFGLDAATGVMRYLEEEGTGYRLMDTVIPLVCGSCIYDLVIGSAIKAGNALTAIREGYQTGLTL